jgi:C-terminal processing protease CtpA/Prc
VGLSAAALAVDLLLNREESAGAKPELKGWEQIEGFLLDVRANSGGYDPNILATFLRGRWSSGDYWLMTRQGRRLTPPEYRALPVVARQLRHRQRGEILALQFRRHGIGPIVGERTAGMASGGAIPHALSDGSTLWLSSGSLEDTQGVSYEGRGIAPDLTVPDRPPAEAGEEDAVIEAAIRALATGRKSEIGNR